MIIDCFPFFNELDLLKIRLHELDPWVDRFVLIESSETSTGNKKPLYFVKNMEMFSEFLPKITFLESPPTENPKSAWDREKNQRDFIMWGLKGCSGNDLILIGDLDEIPRGRDFESLCGKGPSYYWQSVQAQYFYFMNLYRPGAWVGTVVIHYKDIDKYFNGSPHEIRLKRRKGMWLQTGVENRGWHFTRMGGFEKVRLKHKSSRHFDKYARQSDQALRQQMKEGGVIKGRTLVKTPIDGSYPKWFVDNIKDFSHLLIREEENG